MKFSKLILTMAASLIGWTAVAQTPFAHDADQKSEIDPVFFDASLAPFYHGVASGDPLQDAVIIWTRVTPTRDTIIPVKWFMATDTAFTNIVKSGEAYTDYTIDYTVKVDVTGLEPGNTYYYYFQALDANSLIGRTKTLPSNTDHVRLAVVSCANYQMGYFNAYRRISERSDLDAVVHLGDYIYEYATYGYGYTSEVGREHAPAHELNSMDDYRIRHSYYKLDPDLRAAHQQHPFIVVWDDHEIVNNAYTDGADKLYNHDPAEDGDYATRKFNAVNAYLEWMPIREQSDHTSGVRIYREFNFGNLIDLYMVDTRLEERSKQLSSNSDPAYSDTTRTILGRTQRNWLLNKMHNSIAQWQVIGNQVMFSNLDEAFKLDSWQGYPYEHDVIRRQFVNMNDKNIVILTGDTHRSWAFDLKTEDTSGSYLPNTGIETFGVEFGTPSIASPNMDEGNPMSAVVAEEASNLANNPHLRYVDLDRHGYIVLDLTPFKTQADYFYGATKTPSNTEEFGMGMYTLNQQGYLREALSPATEKPSSAPFAPASTIPYHIGMTEPTQNVLFVGAYPNPFWDRINIGVSANAHENVKVEMYSITGELVKSDNYNLTPGNHRIELGVTELASGTYILRVLSEGKSLYETKLVK